MSYKKVIVLCALMSALSIVLTQRYLPGVKAAEVTKEVVRTDIKTVIRSVTLPNGQTETTTETVDHSVKTETDKKTAAVSPKPDWLVSATVQSNLKLEPPVYGGHVDRRILGPMYIGAGLNTKGDVSLSLGMEF